MNEIICGVLTLIRCSGESNTCSSYCSQTQNRESLPAASRTALLISSFSVIRSRCRGALGTSKAGRTLDDFQILNDIKTMGDHRHEDS